MIKGCDGMRPAYNQRKAWKRSVIMELEVAGDIRSTNDVYVQRYLRLHSSSNRLYYNTSNYLTNTELSYLDGVTSNIQTQLNSKGGATITTGASGTINNQRGAWKAINWGHTDTLYASINEGNTVFSMINMFTMSHVAAGPFVWLHGRISKYHNYYDGTGPANSAAFDHAHNLNVCNLASGWMRMDTYFVGSVHFERGYTQSDDRIKHNEKHIINAIEIIRQLNPLKYDKTSTAYDADYQGELHYPSVKEAGFIAQDVLNIPELECFVKKDDVPVFKHNETEQISIHTLDYNCIFTYSVAAVQELDVIVEKQKDSIENQNNEIKAQKDTIENQNNEIQLLKNEIKAQKEQIEKLENNINIIKSHLNIS